MRTQGFEIREATLADVGAIELLWQECGLVRSYNPPARDIEQCLTCPCSTLFVATQETQLLATTMAGHDGHRGWLYYVAVAERWRHRHLGSELIRHAETWLKSIGVRKVQLMVRPTNSELMSFYTKLGYEETPMSIMARWLVED